ncbi:COX15/CtaA family protein [Methylobacterium sp. ID0610]|uniref:COX15/CtaA family protein n=1 Tax=Methylobacterium carpenticola TaxID=3344827 RepID=UPI0036ACE043
MTSAVLAPSAAAGSAPRSRAALRRWLFVMAALVIAMVAVGGATRLTGSGLSITEWKPVTGAIPPLSAEAWAQEFAKYRATPQYDILNRGMSLSEFQFIYAWEWGHRFLGRLIGFAFFLPLGWFWWTGRLDRRLGLGLLALGVLGGLQGAVGWIMVASGLQPGMTAVAPIKLAAHLTLASAIFAGLVWLAAGLDRAAEPALPRRLRWSAAALPLLVLVQIALGGLVAGSKAGLTYNTWPLMDGALIPPLSGLFAVKPWIENFVDNVALVQLNHRLVAYGLLAVAALHWLGLRRTRPGSRGAKRAGGLLGLVTTQAVLGITTLLLAVPLWAGLAHQVMAMLVLGMAVAHARVSTLSPA